MKQLTLEAVPIFNASTEGRGLAYYTMVPALADTFEYLVILTNSIIINIHTFDSVFFSLFINRSKHSLVFCVTLFKDIQLCVSCGFTNTEFTVNTQKLMPGQGTSNTWICSISHIRPSCSSKLKTEVITVTQSPHTMLATP